MPVARRNTRAESLVEQSPLPAWGPDEARALAANVRARGADETPWDLVVVGAGITGAGIARDAAMRGLRTLVLDGSDVAFGTSSRSSRLIHGGVRYLEQGELGLVYEALRERRRLYRMAPHLVHPASFVFPAYRGDRLPLWKLRMGLALYDALSLYQSHHRTVDAEGARAIEPLLDGDELRGAVIYEDAVTDDARLTLTNLQSARRSGAEVLTYTRVERLDRDERGLHRVWLADGAAIRARRVIVAAGPWTSERLLGAPGRGLLNLSRGIHLVVRAEDVPVRQPLVIQVRGERRILFVVPWGTRTYLGTTDTAYEGDPGASGVTREDADELFTLIGRVLPAARLGHDRIVSAWSGVRPLVLGGPRSRRPGSTVELSRKHRLIDNEDGVIGLVGGKLTTYRAMAKDAVDHAIKDLDTGDPERPRWPRATTHRAPLCPGAPIGADELADPLIADLVNRHGPEARVIAARAAAAPELAERMIEDLPYRWIEVDQAIRFEGALHLDDILRRRLPLALTDPEHGARVARRVATMLVRARGDDESAVDAEIERYRESLHRETGRTLPPT